MGRKGSMLKADILYDTKFINKMEVLHSLPACFVSRAERRDDDRGDQD